MKEKISSHIWWFFGCIYLVSGVLYGAIYLSGQGMSTLPNKLMMLCIAFTPSTIGVLFIMLFWDKPAQRDFWKRVFSIPKARPWVVFVSLGMMPLLNIIAYISANVISGEPIKLDYAAKLLTQLPVLFEFLLVEFFLGAVSEELGWRGYAIDELQSRYSAVLTSLIIGGIWALWHTPAFLIPGLSQNEFGGLFSVNYFSMMLGVMAGSILHTWSYNNSSKSIALAGILMHFTQNATMIFLGGIFDQFSMPALFWPILTIMVIGIAAVFVWRYGGKTLTGRQPSVPTVETGIRNISIQAH